VSRALVRGLFAGLVAALAAAGPVFASCECNILARCAWFHLGWEDTCVSGYSSELEKTLAREQRRQLFQRMAHGVAFASQAWHLVQNNPDLRAGLERGPIDFVHSRPGPVKAQGAVSDSVLARFQRADRTAVAKLYTIRLGSYGSRQAAKNAFAQWRFLRPKAGVPITEPALQDSSLSVSWEFSSCAGAWGADLFILPPGLSGGGQYDLDFRLLIDSNDAKKIAKLLEPRLMTRTEVIPVQVTASVLSIALAE
jgi:hypothetical protein